MIEIITKGKEVEIDDGIKFELRPLTNSAKMALETAISKGASAEAFKEFTKILAEFVTIKDGFMVDGNPGTIEQFFEYADIETITKLQEKLMEISTLTKEQKKK